MLTFKNDFRGFLSCNRDKLEALFKNEDKTIEFISCDNPDRCLVRCLDTPLASNPHVCAWGAYQIAYDEDLIESLELNELEVWAIILHEIGHIIRQDPLDDYAPLIEIECDNYATLSGLQFQMASALCKMSDLIKDKEALEQRLKHLSESIVLYRPEWTCGRYNEQKKCAIMYNLIDGMSFYFEDESAALIGELLAIPRWNEIRLTTLSNHLDIDFDSLVEFVEILLDKGLLSSKKLDKKEIYDYRTRLLLRQDERNKTDKQDSNGLTTDSQSAMTYSEAEELFLNNVNGCGSVMIELTYRCTEQCIHCYNPGAPRNENEISNRGKESSELLFADHIRIINDLYDNGLFKVCLSGGDPFCKAYIWDLIEFLYNKEIAFDIFTNGLGLLGKEERLADFYPRSVGISIYSMIPNVHDSITRTKGSLEISTKVARNLARLAIPEFIKCCVMQNNKGSYITVYDFAQEINAVVQVDLNVSNSVDGDKCVEYYLRPSETDFMTLLRDPRTPLFVDLDNIPHLDTEKCNNIRTCMAGINTFCVSPYGDLMPCCAFHYSFGNLQMDSFSSIIHSRPYIYWNSLRLADYKQCCECNDIDFCPLCPGFNYAENQSILKPSKDNCIIANYRHRVFDCLSNNEIKTNPLSDFQNNDALKRVH